MNVIDQINIVLSILGAILFIVSVIYEIRTIRLLNAIQKGGKWKFAAVLTGLFFFGYLANIYSILTANVTLQSMFNAIVYLFGGMFVLLVVTISHSTYQAIFEAAEKNLGEDLRFENK